MIVRAYRTNNNVVIQAHNSVKVNTSSGNPWL